MDLDYIRETIKKEDDITVICALADEHQKFGYRVCPRNIYQDETARKICVNPCRKRYATCFKKYFTEKKYGEEIMSKSVIASLKPYFYYLVGEGIKKVEVRKSKPKADDWNRETYFYMSKDEKSFAKIPKEYQDKYRKHFGKVGLKFVCDRIDTFDYPYLKKPQPEDTMEDIVQFFRKSEKLSKACLSYDAIETYGKGKTLYGWHISDLKIYDKPKELREFSTICEGVKCDGCEYYYVENNESIGLFKDCLCGCEKPIKKAPQSWGYCKELEK